MTMSTSTECPPKFHQQHPPALHAVAQQQARFRHAVYQNNAAVHSIANGRHSQATAALNSSLQTIKDLLEWQNSPLSSTTISSPGPIHVVQENETSTVDTHFPPCGHYFFANPDADSHEDQHHNEEHNILLTMDLAVEEDASIPLLMQDSLPGEQEKQFHRKKLRLYQKALLLDSQQEAQYLDPAAGAERLHALLTSHSAIVIFNLALTRHLAVMARTQDSCFARMSALKNVQQLYELALELAIGVPDDSVDTMILLVNNLGFLHVQLQSYAEASRYFEYLMMVLMYVVDQRINLKDQDRLEMLMQNALLATGDPREHSSSAPAA
jgi:hypothetical protein